MLRELAALYLKLGCTLGSDAFDVPERAFLGRKRRRCGVGGHGERGGVHLRLLQLAPCVALSDGGTALVRQRVELRLSRLSVLLQLGLGVAVPVRGFLVP